jgi:signal transduction histidine kinase
MTRLEPKQNANVSPLTRDAKANSTHDWRRQDYPILIAGLAATRRDVTLTLGIIVALSLTLIAILPFAHVEVMRLDAFIPVLQTVLCFAELVTAVLLFSQYTIQPQLALLALASGYMFTGLFAFLQTLVFPGAYSKNGLFGDTLNTGPWIFVFWHTAFPMAIIAYVLLKDANQTASQRSGLNRSAITITIASVAVAIAGLTWVATKGYLLPILYVDLVHQTLIARYVTVPAFLFSIIALALLFLRCRTILDLCLIVAAFASLPDIALPIVISTPRFTVGWYVFRCYTLFASCTVLVVLLMETTVLYGRLASTNILLRRERENKLTNVQAVLAAIAHEVKQPLTAMVVSAYAGQRFLNKAPPDHDKVKEVLHRIVQEGQRTSDVFDGFRALFRKGDKGIQPVDVNKIILGVLESLHDEFQKHGIELHSELARGLPLIEGNKSQLEEVIFNLVRNAVEAMDTTIIRSRVLRVITEPHADDAIVVAVQDSGPGIDPSRIDGLFGAFTTTKSQGTGLGLAICRMIAEHHGGQISVSSDGKKGTSFRLVLPTTRPEAISVTTGQQ